MKHIIQVIAWFIILICSSNVMNTQASERQKLIAISMLVASDKPAPEQTQTLALIMKPRKGWHGYWRNPGDVGFPASYDWQLPKGVSIAEVQYPAPSQLMTRNFMNYIYHDEFVLLAPLTIDKSIAMGTKITVKLDISYLACSPTSCMPEQQKVATTFVVGNGTSDKNNQAKFNQWRNKLPKPLDSKGQFSSDEKRFTLSLPLPSSIASSNAHIYPVINNMIINNAPQAFIHHDGLLTMQTQVGDEFGSLFQGVLVLDNGIALSFKADKTEHVSFPVNSKQ